MFELWCSGETNTTDDTHSIGLDSHSLFVLATTKKKHTALACLPVVVMTQTEWALALGLSLPALVIGVWAYMVRQEMKDAESKKRD